MTLQPLPEKEMVQRALDGDVRARTEIVLRHQDLVYNLALKLTGNPERAECVLQETFLKVFEKLDTFRLDSALGTWIYRIATNAALMMLRQRKGRLVPMEEEGDDEETSRYARMLKSLDRDPLELLLDTEFKDALERAMAQLPDSWRVPFVLKDIEGLSLQEIAQTMNTTVPAVKAALHRGRTALRDHLAEFIEAREAADQKSSQKRVG
ncbi:MAG: sigma-70 family RNA polymerase sigma factor [Candidatus Zixiibacteriota bacterium]|nr:MAG: sigma-70 family RNA polymerase sigma factor [candidate division Zixibacteria bacterium]